MLLLLLRRLWLLAAVLVAGAAAHYSDPRVESFCVEKNSGGQQSYSVSVGSDKAKVTCILQYETLPVDEAALKREKEEAAKAVPQAAPATPAEQSVQGIVSGLKDQCLSKRIDYWDYEICLESGIKQSHLPDVYSLGQYSGWNGDKQVYDNGQPCEARGDKAPRKVIVSFACSTTSHLNDIRETTVCEYAAVVGTPALCKLPNVPKVAVAASPVLSPQQQAFAETPVRDGSEDWILRLSELADGRFMCSAHSTETVGSAGSQLHFSKFAIQVFAEGLPELSAPDSTHMYVARHPGRVPMHEDEIVVKFSKDERKSTLLSGQAFNGKMSYLKVFA